MCQVLNSHYFHIIGDGHQPNSRVYIPIIRIPIKGGMTIPNIATFDHGTCIVDWLQGYSVHVWFLCPADGCCHCRDESCPDACHA